MVKNNLLVLLIHSSISVLTLYNTYIYYEKWHAILLSPAFLLIYVIAAYFFTGFILINQGTKLKNVFSVVLPALLIITVGVIPTFFNKYYINLFFLINYSFYPITYFMPRIFLKPGVVQFILIFLGVSPSVILWCGLECKSKLVKSKNLNH